MDADDDRRKQEIPDAWRGRFPARDMVDPTPTETSLWRQIDSLANMVAANEEHAAMIRKLEEMHDEAVEQATIASELELRSGDELAAEIQRFLNEQG